MRRLMALLDRLFGRDRSTADLTSDDERETTRERLYRQEARLRALDIQAKRHR